MAFALPFALATLLGIAATVAHGGIANRLWLTFAIGALFLFGYVVRRRLLILAAGLAWVLEGAWEVLLQRTLRDYDDFNIRLDLLIILPLVIGLSAAAGWSLVAPRRTTAATPFRPLKRRPE